QVVLRCYVARWIGHESNYTLVGYLDARHDLGWGQAGAPDGLRGLVGAGVGVRDLGDRPSLGAAGADRGGAVGLGAEAGGARDRARRRLVVVLVCGDRDREVAVPEGRLGGHGARLPIRLDEPGLGARPRPLDLDRLAVHARRVR